MNVFKTLLVLIFTCLLFVCTLAQPGKTASSRLASAHSPREATYLIDREVFALHNGQITVATVPGAASKTVLQIFGEPVSGDLDGDGAADAAVLLVQTTGGSGTFYYVAAALNRGGLFVGTEAIFIGDRIAPQQLIISNDVVIVGYADRRPGEAMVIPPSQEQSMYLVSRGDHLEKISLSEGELIAVGEVVIGYEVQSFTPCGANEAVWIIGDSPALPAVQIVYHQAMSDAPPYTPLFMVLAGQSTGPPVEGFGAEYPAGFYATRLELNRPGKSCSEAGRQQPVESSIQ